MNREFYKVVFSKSVGRHVVVAENASVGAQGARGGRGSGEVAVRLRQAAYAVKCALAASGLALFWSGGAWGQAVPDPLAQAGQRPGSARAANGAPVVNITAPDAQRISVNKFSALDVAAPGLIFNNSKADGASKLGGYMLKNGNLGQGPAAAVIMAEVTGSQASRLQGGLEVFGERADLVLANPNGMVVNGLFAENVRGLSLVAGRSGADAHAFAVRSGMIATEGQGINASGLGYFDLVAQQVKLGAPVGRDDGGEIRIVAGSNDYHGVKREYREAGGVAGSGSGGIDGSAAGSLYAGKVTLIATGSGAGVRHAGPIYGSGDVHIAASGEVRVGQVASGGALALRGGDIVVGTELLGRTVELESAGRVVNHGAVQAVEGLTIQAQVLENTGGLVGDAVALQVERELVNGDNAQIQGVGSVGLTAGSVRNGRGASIVAGDGKTGSLAITAGGAVDNDGGDMLSSDTLQVQAGTHVRNAGGRMSGSRVRLQAGGQLTNGAGAARIEGRESVTLQGGEVDNAGTVLAGRQLDVLAARAYANRGTLQSEGAAALGLGGAAGLRVDGGTRLPQAKGMLTLDVGDLDVDVEENVAGSLQVNARGAVRNHAALLVREDLRVAAQGLLHNDAGALLWAGRDQQLQAQSIVNEAQGEISAGRDLVLQAASIRNAGAATLQAGRDLALDTAVLENEARRKGGVQRRGSEPVQGEHRNYHSGREDYYALQIEVPLFGSDLEVTPALIQAGGTIRINQGRERGKRGQINNRNGQILAGADLLVDGDVHNLSAMGALSTDDYLDAASKIRLEIQPWSRIGTALDAKGGHDYGNLRQMLEAFLGDPDNGGRDIPGGTVLYKWWPDQAMNTLRQMTGSAPLNQLLNEVLGVGWQAQEYSVLSERWRGYKSRPVQGFYAAQKTEMAAGGQIGHTGGELVNGANQGAARRETVVQVGQYAVPVTQGQFGAQVAAAAPPSLEELLGNRRSYTLKQVAGLALPPVLAPVQGAAGAAVLVRPLYETRFEYVDQGKFYGSQYFFDQVGYRPDRAVAVLADNYLTNELVNRQVAHAVGGYFASSARLTDVRLVQYLMDNAGEVAGALGLLVGQAPTAEQLARAQKDFVWYVVEEVAGQVALVPRVYLTAATLAAHSGGGNARIAAGAQVASQATELVNVNGNIQGGQGVTLAVSGGVLNAADGGVQGGIRSGSGQVAIRAGGDVRNLGASIAGADVALAAGGRLESESGTGYDAQGRHGVGNVARIASAGTTQLQSGGDMSLVAASVQGKDTQLVAGGKLEVKDLHVVEATLEESTRKGAGGLGFSHSEKGTVKARAVGSELAGAAKGGTLQLQAQGDIVLQGGRYGADRGSVQAGGDVVSKSSQDYSYSKTSTQMEELSLGGRVGLAGQGADARYGTVNGAQTQVVRDNYAAGKAGDGKLNEGKAVLAETLGADIGYRRSESTETSELLQQRNAELHFGEALVVGGKKADIGGADIAVSPTGKLALRAGEIVSTKYENVEQHTREETSMRFGLGTEGHSALADVINHAQKHVQDSKEGLSANGAAIAGQVVGDASNLVFNDTVGGSTSLRYQVEKSSSSSSTRAQNMNRLAGGTIELTATQGDIALQGVELKAGQRLLLDAAGSMVLKAGESRSESRSDYQSHQVTAGVNYGANAVFQTANVGVSAGYNGALDKSASSALVHSNSKLSGQEVVLRSGRDSTLRGATVAGDTVALAVGGNLNVASVQDSLELTHERADWGLQVGTTLGYSGQTAAALGVGGLRGGVSVNVDAGYGKDWDRSRQTKEQSGIVAGKSLDATVGGDLHLAGAALGAQGGAGKVQVAGQSSFEVLQDWRDKDGGYGGMGVGITVGASEKVGLSGVSVKAEVVEQVAYRAGQLATLGVDDFSSGSIAGKANKDLAQRQQVTQDRRTAGVEISATLDPDQLKGLGKKGEVAEALVDPVQEGARSKPAYDSRLVVQAGDDRKVADAAHRLADKHPGTVLVKLDADGGAPLVLHGDPGSLAGATKVQVVGHGDDAGGKLGGKTAPQLAQAVAELVPGADVAKVALVGCGTGACGDRSLAIQTGEALAERGIAANVKGYAGRIDVQEDGRKQPVARGGLGNDDDPVPVSREAAWDSWAANGDAEEARGEMLSDLRTFNPEVDEDLVLDGAFKELPPVFPEGVTKMEVCSSCPLTVSAWPTELKELILNVPSLTLTETAALPNSLNVLDMNVGHGPLPALPASVTELRIARHDEDAQISLPPALQALTLEGTGIRSLPPLPPTLGILNMGETSIVALPQLPDTLYELDLQRNRITQLPDRLPSNLENLWIVQEGLAALPPLPPNLRQLRVLDSNLRSLPELPTSLVLVNLDNNALTSLPASLLALPGDEGGVADVFLTANPLSERVRNQLAEAVSAPGYLGPTISFSMHAGDEVPRRPLYQAVADWYPEGIPEGTPWHALDSEAAQEFSVLLDKLHRNVNSSNTAFREETRAWLDELARSMPAGAAARSPLLDATLAAAFEGCQTCEDRVALTLNKMKGLVVEHRIRQGSYDQDPPALEAEARQMFRLAQLDEIAAEKVRSLRFVDEIEVYLAYQVKLKESLGLRTVVPDMRFYEVSYVTPGDLAHAAERVQQREREGFISWAAEWEPLREAMQRRWPERYKAAQEQLSGMVEKQFDTRLSAQLQRLGLEGDDDARRTLGPKVMKEMEQEVFSPLAEALFVPDSSGRKRKADEALATTSGKSPR